MHGCFWHRHNECRYASMPKSNVDFWNEKFKKNTLRDASVKEKIKEIGWESLIIWECEIKNVDSLLKRVRSFLE